MCGLTFLCYQGRYCSRCLYGSGCHGCIIPRSSSTPHTLRPGDYITVTVERRGEGEGEECEREETHPSLATKRELSLTLEECLKSFSQRYSVTKYRTHDVISICDVAVRIWWEITTGSVLLVRTFSQLHKSSQSVLYPRPSSSTSRGPSLPPPSIHKFPSLFSQVHISWHDRQQSGRTCDLST